MPVGGMVRLRSCAETWCQRPRRLRYLRVWSVEEAGGLLNSGAMQGAFARGWGDVVAVEFVGGGCGCCAQSRISNGETGTRTRHVYRICRWYAGGEYAGAPGCRAPGTFGRLRSCLGSGP